MSPPSSERGSKAGRGGRWGSSARGGLRGRGSSRRQSANYPSFAAQSYWPTDGGPPPRNDALHRLLRSHQRSKADATPDVNVKGTEGHQGVSLNNPSTHERSHHMGPGPAEAPDMVGNPSKQAPDLLPIAEQGTKFPGGVALGPVKPGRQAVTGSSSAANATQPSQPASVSRQPDEARLEIPTLGYIPPHMRGANNGVADWAIEELRRSRAAKNMKPDMPPPSVPAGQAAAGSSEETFRNDSNKQEAGVVMNPTSPKNLPSLRWHATGPGQKPPPRRSPRKNIQQSSRTSPIRQQKLRTQHPQSPDMATSLNKPWATEQAGPGPAEDDGNSNALRPAEKGRGPWAGWSSENADPPGFPAEKGHDPWADWISDNADPPGVPHELLQWDGTMLPAPVEWEMRPEWEDRKFDRHMIGWLKKVETTGVQRVDAKHPGFLTGDAHADDYKLVAPPDPGITLPNPERLANPGQSSSYSMMNHHVSSLNKSLNKRAKRQLYVSLPELEKVPLEEVYVNPNQPKVKIYLRYARRSDMSGCLQIYEHFRKETVVAPEMGVVTPSEMLATYDDVASNKLPFLVAVEGQLGSHGREPRSVGKVVGYAFAEDFAGSYTAYCYTAEIQIFIHPEFLHKGVGKCLMDMLLLLLDPAHVQRGGYRFLSEGSEWCAGGKRVISKVICNIPFAKDDAEIGWKKDWLVNWEFEEVGRLVKVGVKHMKWVSVLQMLRTTGSRIYNVSG